MGYALPSCLTVLLLGSLVAQGEAPTAAAEPAESRPFMRFVEQHDLEHLDVMIAVYRKGDVTLTLNAAVHVADPEHYAAMQKRFEAFDVLLYELIADDDLRPHPGLKLDEDNWFSMMQAGLGRGLQLAKQLASIDYRKKNFVHADMTGEQWQAELEKAGKGLMGELVSMNKMDPDREAEAKQRPLDIAGAYRRGQGAHEVRIMGARMIANPDASRGEPTILIEGRNSICLKALEEQMALGKKKIGIYYGAAHMQNMEHRLLTELGWEKVAEEWVVAWDCSAKRFPTVEKGLQQKRYRAKQDLDDLKAALDRWQKANSGVEPTWQALRAAQSDGKLPGRADGKDPWGRDYVLRKGRDAFEVRCLGSDGAIDTEDDLCVALTE